MKKNSILRVTERRYITSFNDGNDPSSTRVQKMHRKVKIHEIEG